MLRLSYSTLRRRSTPRSWSSETSLPPFSPTAPYHTVSPSHHSIYTPCRQRSVTFWILSDRSWTLLAGMPAVHFPNQHDPAFDHSSFACRGNGQRPQGQGWTVPLKIARATTRAEKAPRLHLVLRDPGIVALLHTAMDRGMLALHRGRAPRRVRLRRSVDQVVDIRGRRALLRVEEPLRPSMVRRAPPRSSSLSRRKAWICCVA